MDISSVPSGCKLEPFLSLLNHGGKQKGCLKNEKSNMALEEFPPLPRGFAHACVKADVIILLLQSLKFKPGNPAVHI